MLHPVLKVEDDSKFMIHNKGYSQSGYFKVNTIIHYKLNM